MDAQDISVPRTFSRLSLSSVENAYDELSSWSTGQIKDFLMVRGLSYTGSRQELVARAYVAHEQKADIRLNEKELFQNLSQEYQKRLSKCSLVDPRNVRASEWINDCKQWPKIDLGKIFSFIIENKEQEIDFIGKYKTHKAYSYFQSGFVVTIYTNRQGNITVIKTKVTPSMSVRNTPHEVWVAIDSANNIQSSWCTCIAGFAQTCNHVIATLYKLEFAATMGYIDPSCTSMPCNWNNKTKKTVQPARLSEMNIRQDTRLASDKSVPINTNKKYQFDPRRADQQHLNSNNFSSLLGKLHRTKPSAVIFKSLPCAPTEQSENQQSILEIVTNYTSCGGEPENFLEHFRMSQEQVEKIEMETREQTNNILWHEQRKGRLTSSFHHEIHTKMNTLSNNKGLKPIKVSPLIARLLGQSINISNIESVKWGLDMEEKAYDEFIKSETLKHLNLRVSKSGLIIKQDIPYIACSPDGICVCRCCGKSTLEIKCPYTLAKPTPKTVLDGYKDVSFLELTDGKINLKRTHKYYTQVQSQMAISGCKQGFFVVWSPVGEPHIETLSFDYKHWCTVQQNLVQFYSAYMLRYLFGKAELSFCPQCSNVCLSEQEIEKEADNSVSCSSCSLWFHWSCAGIRSDPGAENWYCSSCSL